MSKIFEALKKVQAEAMGKMALAPEPDESPTPGGPTAPGELAPPEVPASFAAELVSMRYSLDAKVSRAHKALTFTCAIPNEGVSTVSRMFAEVLVQDPAVKVILIDANMHGPSVHAVFGADISGGLTDVLFGRKDLNDCIKPTKIPRLSVMSSGEPITAPMQAFASDQMKKLISDLLSIYEYVIFDAPPVLVNAEATVLSSQTDGVVFVIEAVRTKKEVAKKAIEAVDKAGGQVLGVVLNKNKHFIPEFIYKRV
jgi:capsular exopolysaccharide synthesis family protein